MRLSRKQSHIIRPFTRHLATKQSLEHWNGSWNRIAFCSSLHPDHSITGSRKSLSGVSRNSNKPKRKTTYGDIGGFSQSTRLFDLCRMFPRRTQTSPSPTDTIAQNILHVRFIDTRCHYILCTFYSVGNKQ